MQVNNLIEKLFDEKTTYSNGVWDVEVYLDSQNYPNTQFKTFYFERKLQPIVSFGFAFVKERFLEFMVQQQQPFVNPKLKDLVSSVRISDYSFIRDNVAYYNQLSNAEKKLFKRLAYYYLCKIIRRFNAMNLLRMDSYITVEVSHDDNTQLMREIGFFKMMGFQSYTKNINIVVQDKYIPMIAQIINVVQNCLQEDENRKKRYFRLEYELQRGTRFQEPSSSSNSNIYDSMPLLERFL